MAGPEIISENYPRPSQIYTDGKSKAESNIPNGVHSTVGRIVSLVNDVPQLRHHGAVHHPDSEAEAAHGDDQLGLSCGHRNLGVGGGSQGMY